MSEEKLQQALVAEKVEFVIGAIKEDEFLSSVLEPIMKNQKKQKQFSQSMEQIFADMIMVFTLNGDKVSLADIGLFEPRLRKERPGKNPGLVKKLVSEGVAPDKAHEMAKTIIPEHYALAFSPSRKAKDEIMAFHSEEK